MARHVLAAAALFSVSAMPTQAQTVPPVAATASSPRSVIPLADNWRFVLGDAPGAEMPRFDDSGWLTVSVPHTWNRVGYYIDPRSPDSNRPETVNRQQGIGWYRRSFAAPAGLQDKRVWLEFDAASRVAEVWLNGKRLGEHRGGFSRFRLDATDALRQDGPNVLAVRTDNTQPAADSSTNDVFPLAGDFFVHGGLYRPVRLIVTDAVQFDMLDEGGTGVYASTTAISPSAAKVSTTVRLRNSGNRRARVTVTTSLVDANGRAVASENGKITLAAGGAGEVGGTLDVAGPRLWQGVDDPYLYQLVAEVRINGRLVDTVSQDFGIRQMRFDPQNGFFLNDRPYKLRGVGYHQDREGKGWAISEADVAQDLAMLRDMGATSVRLTHYQHGEPVHRLADRMGLILWDEISLVSSWTIGQETEATPERRANALQQLRELIRQNHNHASVAVWGLANELDFGISGPGFLTAPNGRANDPFPLLADLRALAKIENPERPTTLATCCEDRGLDAGSQVPLTSTAVDLGGANRYFGWYYGQPSELGPHLDRLRATRPDQPLAITEYGAGGAITMQSDHPLGGPADFRGRIQPEQYMSWVHEQNWAQMKDRNDLWATWLWAGFDFATTVRREGDADDINTKGLITYDRQIKKDPFYFYRANWSGNPTVHITGSRYVNRAYAVTGVKVYSNAASTELVVNGRSLGTLPTCPNMVCEWQGVRLQQGANTIVARGSFATGPVENSVTWQLAADSADSYRIDSGAILAAKSSAGVFGSDTFFNGGEAGTVNTPGDYGRPAEEKEITGTEDDLLMATYREGDFDYHLPARAGNYTLRLSFMEPKEAAGARQFDVMVNGVRRIAGLDVAATAGGQLSLVQRIIPVKVSDGGATIAFRGVKGKAIVSSIELLRAN